MARLPIVELFFDAEAGEYNDETGKSKLYFADLRLGEYRSIVDPSDVVREWEVGCNMEDIIRGYEVMDEEKIKNVLNQRRKET